MNTWKVTTDYHFVEIKADRIAISDQGIILFLVEKLVEGNKVETLVATASSNSVVTKTR